SVRFLPAANFHGAPGTLSLRLADTVQSAATGVNLSASTGSTGTWSTVVSLDTSVDPRNDAPVLSGSVGATFTEGGAPAALLSGALASDIDLPGVVTFGGGSITVSLDTWRAGDLLSLPGGLPGVAGVTGGNGASLVVSLSTAATPATMGAILNALRFLNTSSDPANHLIGPDDLDRTYNVVLNDGNNLNGAVNAGGNGGGDPTLNSNVVTGVITLVPVNDPPVATNDAVSLTENTASISGNVKTGIGGTLDTDLDHRNDELQVDAIRTGGVEGAGTSGQVGGAALAGLYGSLVMGANGAYTYTLDTAHPQVNVLSSGETLTEQFNYRLVDPDGGSDSAVLTITITGIDDGVPTISASDGNGTAAGEATVFESGLTADGPAGEARTGTGSLVVNTPSGLATVTIGGTSFTVAQLAGFTAGNPSAVIDTGEGQIRITGLAVVSGPASAPTAAMVGFVYLLKAPLTHASPGADEVLDSVILAVADLASAASSGSDTLTIRIVDDTPTARDNTAAVGNETATSLQTSGQVVTARGLGDVSDRLGADAVAAPVVAVSAGGITSAPGATVTGSYGQLTLSASGAYTYRADPANPAVAGLGPGSTLVDVFRYTITDADGDTSTAALTITIRGEAVPLPLTGKVGLQEGERQDRSFYALALPRLTPPMEQSLHVQKAVREARAIILNRSRLMEGLPPPPGEEVLSESLSLDMWADHSEHVSRDGVRFAHRLFASSLEPPGALGNSLRLGTETLFDAFSPFTAGTPAVDQSGDPLTEPEERRADTLPAVNEVEADVEEEIVDGADSAAATATDPAEADDEEALEVEDANEDEEEAEEQEVEAGESAAAGAAGTVAGATNGFSRQLRQVALERALTGDGRFLQVKHAPARSTGEPALPKGLT
ncbi:MAG: VCBS domain-containing protein, partial [Betaproteobacteria bacterium]